MKFILREFPLDPLATAGFMLARCEGADKRAAVIDLLFDKQQSWAFVDKPLEALSDILKQTGMSKDAFEACLKDQKLYDNVNEVRDPRFTSLRRQRDADLLRQRHQGDRRGQSRHAGEDPGSAGQQEELRLRGSSTQQKGSPLRAFFWVHTASRAAIPIREIVEPLFDGRFKVG